MKFCINITSGMLSGTLEDDNLRGEGRWERMIARGLVKMGVPVGTRLQRWGGDSPNWIGQIEDFSDCVYVTVYGGLGSFPPGAHAYLFQFFSGPNAPIEAEIRDVMAKSGRRNVFLIHSYRSDGCFDKLPSDLRDRAAFLPIPVAEPTTGDSTQRTVLFHSSRNTLESLFGDGGALLQWIRQALRRDASLTFETVSGTYEAHSASVIWQHPLFKSALGDLRERVVVHPPLTGSEVQAIYARTRLVVCPSAYGGPPVESARHGIPVIALERDCAFYSAPYTPGFSVLPRLNVHGTLVEILERLLCDRDHARRVGDAGRRYVAEHYSQSAFERALRGVLERL